MMISREKLSKNIEYKNLEENETKECFICFEGFNKYSCQVICCICGHKCHYSCYKKFVKKNKDYNNLCLQCNTKTIYNKKPWWLCCYF